MPWAPPAPRRPGRRVNPRIADRPSRRPVRRPERARGPRPRHEPLPGRGRHRPALGRAADNPEDLLKDLELDDHREPTWRIVVVDAVDEARDPQRLLTDLLVPLARRPGLRGVIGARRHVLPPAADTSLLIDLDSDQYRDPRALAD